MLKKKVAIIDYGMGNIFSIYNAFLRFDVDVYVTKSSDDILSSDYAVLPGVGAFPDAMKKLRELQLDATIVEFVNSGKPILGICLGMQLLCDCSDENGRESGLGIIPASVKRFPRVSGYAIPQIQWNKVFCESPRSSLLYGIQNGSFFYFLHSYYVEPTSTLEYTAIFTSTYCGIKYCSGIEIGNVFATQFHPEKSTDLGSVLLGNFLAFGGS